MIIPEHKERILRDQKKWKLKQRPVLDEQEWEIISRAIGNSKVNQETITLVLYGEYEDTEVTGIVTKVDQQLRRVRVDQDDEWQWIALTDIIKAHT